MEIDFLDESTWISSGLGYKSIFIDFNTYEPCVGLEIKIKENDGYTTYIITALNKKLQRVRFKKLENEKL